MKKKLHEKELKKLKHSEMVHKQKMTEVNEQLEEKAKENQEKIFRKYMSFYFIRKDKQKVAEDLIKKSQEKFQEKSEKIAELARNTRVNTISLEKKLKDIESRKEKLLKQKKNDYKDFLQRRETYYRHCFSNKDLILNDLKQEAKDILNCQTLKVMKSKKKDDLNEHKKNNSTAKTLSNQLNFEKNLRPFNRRIEYIKSESIIKIPLEERRNIYTRKKKAEKEAKKKEEEEKLMNMNLNM